MLRTTRLTTPIALLTAFALGGCSDDPAEPGNDLAPLAGVWVAEDDYGAILFTTTQAGTTEDWLALGASISIELAANGRTTGRIFVPGADEDGSDFDEDLTGTWSLRGDTVHFSHSADTFIRDTPFLVRGDRLEADEMMGDTRIQVVLQKRQ